MKAKVKLIIVLTVEFIVIAAMLLLIFFAGKKTYTVTFDLNGGTLLSGELTQRVTQGQSATPPSVVKDGCYFLQWSGSYRQVTRNVTVKAIWEYETTYGIDYTSTEDSNYCEISGCFKDIKGDVYIGAYHDNKKVLGIKESAFANCKSIENIYLLDGILTIADGAFENCVSLKSIVLPSTLTRLGKDVFKGCESLETIILPEGLEMIEEGAFSGCTALKEIILPQSLLKIGSGVFDSVGLMVRSYFSQHDIPKGWAMDWKSEGVLVEWEYVDEAELPENEDEKAR